jgi:hypothetical protein
MLYANNAFYKKPCPKCGMVLGPSLPKTILSAVEDEILIQTHTAEYCNLACDEIKQEADNRRKLPEHLHKMCKCCGWHWLEITYENEYMVDGNGQVRKDDGKPPVGQFTSQWSKVKS